MPIAFEDVLGNRFADAWILPWLAVEDACRLEAVDSFLQAALRQSQAWEHCACESLASAFRLQGLPWRGRVSRREQKAAVSTLRCTETEGGPLRLGSWQDAWRLAQAIRRMRSRAAKASPGQSVAAPQPGPLEGQREPLQEPHVVLCRFRFPPRAAVVAMTPARLRMCISNAVVVPCPGIREDTCAPHEASDAQGRAWSIQLGWRDTYVIVRVRPVVDDAQAGLLCDWTPPLLDIQVHSAAVVLRAHGVRPGHGAWTRVAGLCFLTASRDSVAEALASGLDCVVCLRDGEASEAGRQLEHARRAHEV